VRMGVHVVMLAMRSQRYEIESDLDRL
jgi:hypothetical protein